MNAAAIVQMVLYLLGIVVGNLKQSTATAEIQQAITGIEAAILKLQEVQGSDVTYEQLESLRIEKTW